MAKVVEVAEFGVTCIYPESFSKKLGSHWNVTKKLSLPRAFSLLAVSQLIEEFQGVGMTAISCVDAVPALGISGLTWSKIFGKKVSVMVNVADEESKQVIAENMDRNNLNPDDIFVVNEDANALLHAGKKFNFVYLEAYGTAVRYLEAACRNVCHRGMICVVSTDLSTLYNKCPQRVLRLYSGQVMKHEYDKELTVRLIIANIIRAASRWDKGIAVLSSHFSDDAVTIIVRVLKGATHADEGLGKISKVAHCRICNYRCLIPEKLYYSPKPSIGDCLCSGNEDENGDIPPPIVMLGPVATVSIMDTRFLLGMIETLSQLTPKSKHIATLKTMALESMCFSSEQEENEFLKIMDGIIDNSSPRKISENVETSEPPCKKTKGNKMEEFLTKFAQSDPPLFYFVGQNHTKRGFNPPKIHMIINQLRSEGFKACRTSFDPRGIKTSASPKEFDQSIDKISIETV